MSEEDQAIIRELNRLRDWLMAHAIEPDEMNEQCAKCPAPITVYGVALQCLDVADRISADNPAKPILIEWLTAVADYGQGKRECCPPQPTCLWDMLRQHQLNKAELPEQPDEIARILADQSPIISEKDAALVRAVSVRRLRNIASFDKKFAVCRVSDGAKTVRYRRDAFFEWLEKHSGQRKDSRLIAEKKVRGD